jgi:hypothetical protein
MIIAPRYDGWFDTLIEVAAKDIPQIAPASTPPAW